jgi:type I restriction enzyme, S subunit
MIADLKPYPGYRESGSPWLAHVPLHWKVHKLRTLIRPRKERNRADLPLLSVARERGVFVRSLTDADENHNVIPENLSNYKVARAGNLVINKMKAWQGSMGIAPCDGIVSPAYFVFDFGIANHRFGQVLLRSKPYVSHFGQASDGVRVGQWDLTIPGMRQIPVLVPPPVEQAAIVRFLDWANGRLDRAIKAKRKVIALLNEQKQAIIHLAVTRGLDLSVPLKPSGIPWLGDIPQHWEVARLKFLVRRITDGEHISPSLADQGIPLLSAKDVRDRIILMGGDKFVKPEQAARYWRRCCPQKGDILVVSRGATIGRVAVVERNDPFCLMGSVILCNCRKGYSSGFLYYALNARHAQTSLWFTSASSAQQAIYIKDVAELRLPIPPSNERLEIEKHLDVSTSEFCRAIEVAENEIALIREYRTRLVADVVTGKLDVREAAARLPEEAGESVAESETDWTDDETEFDPTVSEEAL